MADKNIRGRFVWHELMTADSAAAHAFYNKVLGWTSQPWEHDPSYSMFAAASGPLGGTVAESADVSGWVHYVGTPDIEATVQQAKGLGASVVKEITSTGGGGSYAILTDPQGAKFAVYASTADHGREKPPKRGEFSWHELATTDSEAALKFYGALFGWEKVAEHDMGPMGFYYLFGRNGNPLGGVFNKTADMPGGPAWLGYVRVKDVSKIVKKAKSAGGTLINGPMEVPGGDWIAQFADPHGTMFAVHAVKADVEPAAAQPAVAATAPAPVAAEKKAGGARKSASSKQKSTKQKSTKKKPAKSKPAKKKVVKKAVKKKAAAKKRRVAAKSVKRPARTAVKARKAPKKQQKRTSVKTRSSRKASGKVRKPAGRKAARKGK